MDLIPRPAYIDWLEKWRSHDLVKVVTGVRRCGKSTILQLFRQHLQDDGVRADQLIVINLEDPDQERTFSAGLTLHETVKHQLVPGQPTYVFIDEAQHLGELERTVAGLALEPTVDLYLTGSNSSFLSGDLATRLTGRYVDIHVLPMSYAEAAAHLPAASATPGAAPFDPLALYLRHGGFPYVLRLGDDETMIRQYLTSVLNTITLKDIAPRQASFSPMLFDSVLDFMVDNVGNLASIKRISDTLTSLGRKTSRTAVEHYIAGLVDSYVLYRAPRYDVKGKAYLENSAKYYVVDPGLRWALLGGQRPDAGNRLENVVYLELLRRGYRVSVGKVGAAEIDFIAELDGAFTYIQVTQRVDSPDILARELAPLRAVPDHYPRLLLVGDDTESVSHEGIRQISVRDWLLGH